MKKVLIVYNKIWSYREPIFNLLNEKFDLTVGYSDESYINKKFNFKTIYLPVKKVGPFEFHKNNLNKVCNDFDIVIGISNIRWISLLLLGFKKNRKFKLGYWGIGVTASYVNKFDSKSTWDFVRYYLAKNSDFTIFYSSYPIKKYVKAGVPANKLFVANNTTSVYNTLDVDYNAKVNFLFLGTLYPQKGINELLEAYLELYRRNDIIPNLLIVGDGPEKNRIIEFIRDNNLSEKIKLYGSVYDPIQLSQIFSISLACISPNQAGLSVLNSMGNHTCFVTSFDAITGGEIFNIKHKFNGLIYNRNQGDTLYKSLEWLTNNKSEVDLLNKNSYDYYINNRLPQMMANNIINAVNYSIYEE